jgi:hypothetical protein
MLIRSISSGDTRKRTFWSGFRRGFIWGHFVFAFGVTIGFIMSWWLTH